MIASTATAAIGANAALEDGERRIDELDATLPASLVHTESTDRPHRGLWAAVIAGSLLSLGISARIAARTFVLGSHSGGWVYGYLYRFQPRSLVICLIVAACCAVPVMLPLAEVQRRQWSLVVMWLAVGLLSQGVLRGLTPYTMEAMVVGDGSNGFYEPTLKYRGSALLRDFNRLRPTLPEHPRTNMPGKIMLTYALEVVSARPAVLGWLIVVVSNLGGVFLYLFVRDYVGDRETALASLIFYLFVPARFLLFPVLNTVTPVFVLACAWCWVRLLVSRELKYAIALGILSYVIIFFEPTPAVMSLFFAFLTGYALSRGEVSWRFVLAMSGVVMLAFVCSYVVMLIVYRFDLVTTLRAVAADAVEFNRRVRRPYGSWVARNLLDLAFGAGICQAVVFGWRAIGAAVPAQLRAGGTHGRLAAFCLGTTVALLATDLAGINRGEVVRLWIFFACFMQVPAAFVCARLQSRVAIMLVLGTTLLQDAVSASMLAFAQP